jgi:transposase
MPSAANKIDISREALRVLVLHVFRLGSSVREATAHINQAMGEDTISPSTVDRWFHRFRDGDTTFEDTPRPGRPASIDVDALKALVEETPGCPLVTWQSVSSATTLQC